MSTAIVTTYVSTGDNRKRRVEVAAEVARGQFVREQVPLTIPVSALRHTTGVPLTAAETAGGFNVSVGSNIHKAQAEITDNETEASVCLAQFVLPPTWLTGSPITVVLPVALIKTGSPTDNGSTIDLSAYRQADGAVGSDLVTTAAQTFAALDTWYQKEFALSVATLAAGDLVNLVITASVIDSEAGGGTIRLNMDAPQVMVDLIV